MIEKIKNGPQHLTVGGNVLGPNLRTREQFAIE